MRFRSTSIFQVEVPQAAVVTDYSDAIVIDQEVRGITFILLKSWIFIESPRLWWQIGQQKHARDIKIPIIIHMVIYIFYIFVVKSVYRCRYIVICRLTKVQLIPSCRFIQHQTRCGSRWWNLGIEG